eukprot:gb/GFBE01074026.1/.p1 GENE.gb/GFBE01074026.1/~~gb/GFBE01074026.1/.p1  ORF type:complete len:200 (+),score=38.88 gb/GFBE01074026.1/:1-600(+)
MTVYWSPSFHFVAIPVGALGVAVAGQGMFLPEEVPEVDPGQIRIGFQGGEPLPGARQLLELRTPGRGGDVDSAIRKSITDLLPNFDATDDLKQADLTRTEDHAHVVQLFNAGAGDVILTTVRETSDGNMAGGSFYKMPVPASLSSACTRAFLMQSRQRGQWSWCRLATAAQKDRAICFKSLGEYADAGSLDSGLCICSC